MCAIEPTNRASHGDQVTADEATFRATRATRGGRLTLALYGLL